MVGDVSPWFDMTSPWRAVLLVSADPCRTISFHPHDAQTASWGPRPALRARTLFLNDHRGRISPAGTGPEMAGALAEDAGVRSDRRSLEAEVLLPRDVRVSVGTRARRPRPQLHHRGCRRAAETAPGFQRAASLRLGRVRPAGRERRDQERHS